MTGATGLLGVDLCRVFKPDHELIGWARRVGGAHAAGPSSGGSRSIVMESVDITDAEAVQAGISRWRPDLVVHSAAVSDVDACELDPRLASAVNAQGVEHVARACESVGSWLFAISTDYVFEGSSDHPYREEEPPNPVNVYGASKLDGERAALQLCQRSLVIRVSGLFGASRANFVTSSVRRFRSGEPVLVVTDQRNSPSYTVDIAQAIHRLSQRLGSMRGILHLANGGGASRLEVGEEMARLLEAPRSLIRQTTWAALSRPARRPPNSQLDTSRCARILGTPLRSWPDALRAFLTTEILDPRLKP